VPPVNENLKNIFEEADPAPEATIRKFRIVLQWKWGQEMGRVGNWQQSTIDRLHEMV